MSSIERLAQKKQTTVTTKNRPVRVDKQVAQFQNIFNNIPIAMVTTDWSGHIKYMNRAARQLLGEAAKDLEPGEWPQEFGLYLDDGLMLFPGHKLPLVRALQGGTLQTEELILRKNGNERGIWVSMSAELIRGDDGNAEGAIILIEDITYRKQVQLSQEKQARRTEALYKLSRSIAEAGTNLNEITQLAVKFTSEEIGDLALVTLLNSRRDKLRIVAFHDITPTGQALLRKSLVLEAEHDLQGITGGVVRSGEPLLIPSIETEQLQAISLPEFKDFIDKVNIESILIVPLIGRGGVLGTIDLSRHHGHKPFNVEDQSFLTDISYRVALAVENCYLFESLRAEVSERLSAKQALDMSEERFRSIFESVTHGIKVLDLEGKILQTNYAFQEMIGYSENELREKHFHSFLYPEDVPQAVRLFQDVKTRGVSSFRFEHRAVHKDNSIVWVKTLFTVVKNGDEDGSPAFIVGIVENVTEPKRIEMEMAELNSRLQNSMELERLRLAQELHDSPMQSLYSAIYRIEELRNTADPEMKDALKDVKQTVQNVLQDLRATAKELRPPTIFNFGLENAIRSHANDFVEKHPGINIHLSLAHDRQILPEKVRLALFRIFQQSLANVVRHAEATEVHVRFSFDAEEAILEVSDNGKGFNVPPNWIQLVRHGHYGLAGAAERATALGGSLTVKSKPGDTTMVRAVIPWKDSTE